MGWRESIAVRPPLGKRKGALTGEARADILGAYRRVENTSGGRLSGEARSRIETAVTGILEAIGEDPRREGLVKTPSRVARMFDELTAGYDVSPEALINGAVFESPYDEMVVVKDIEFYSLCEHHLLPFYGRCHLAYVPDGKIIGLSKIPRIVDAFTRRIQIQERLTWQIADFFNVALQPHGTTVVMEAMHLCMMMRGVKKCTSKMVTSSMLGVFKKDERTRAEFMSIVRGKDGG
ncbi:MAG: GTP cyclohydrolase I FolE [Nitrospirae bacterium]|nr:GTP cyclohydrolase I FolE [Nitrospirota bacterium]